MTEHKNGKTVLTREQILQAQDISAQLVEVPEWGGSVWVRGLNGVERDDYEATLIKGRGRNRDVNLHNMRAKLVARACVVSEEANAGRLFSDEDAAVLAKKSAAALERVFSVAQRLSGLTEADVEELSKDLGEGQSSASGTD